MSTPVLIVVPCLNEAAHLPALLHQMLSQSAPDDLVVVADGGSTDGSQAIVERMALGDARLRLLTNPARLQSAGINAAVRTYGEGRDYLVRVDAHARYPDHYVRGLIETALSRSADCVVVPMRTVAESCFQRAAATAQNSRIGTGGAAHRMGGVSGWVDHGHHALMRLNRFQAVGGYDESFSHNEDAELDLRLSRAGARIWLEASLSVDYLPRRGALSLFRQYLNYGRGRAKTLRRHRQSLRSRQVLPLAVLPSVAAALTGLILFPIHPTWLLLAAPALAWAAACLAGGAAAAVKSGAGPCGWLAGPVAMIMHLAWSIGFFRGMAERQNG